MKFLVMLVPFMILDNIDISAVPVGTGSTVVGPSESAILVKGPTNRATVKGPSGPKIIAVGNTGAVSSGSKSGGIVNAEGQTPGVITTAIQASPAVVPIAAVGAAAPIVTYDQVAVPYGLAQQYASAQLHDAPIDSIILREDYYGKTIY